MKAILDGVKVVEVAAWTYVPMAGAVLAEWGAEVIKIEHPEHGDPQRGLISSGLVPGGGSVNHMMEVPNRGKKSVGLDLASTGGHEVLLKMAAGADVFLTNFLPAARRRLGFEVEDVRAVNPGIVYARGSAAGQRGPESERGGYDLASFWARAGSADINTPPGSAYPTQQPGPAYGDVMAGLTLAGGIVAALLHRDRTGEALTVDNSLLAMGMWATGATLAGAALFGMDRLPFGTHEDMPNPLVNYYRTKDGRYLLLNMLQYERFWPELVTAAGRPELAADPRFATGKAMTEHRAECIAVLDEIFAERTFEEWKSALADIRGVWAPVQRASEIIDDPQARANGYMSEVEAPDGSTFRLVPAPLQFDETPSKLVRAPAHGEHTDEVLRGLGLTDQEIIDLKVGGAVL
ncbi:CaiB/BaiF CoA transferase family protein [Actinomadura sp. SCN-SB]|uniref:CaiB/BaiF CoA transferase family protein n=1 Tax=Actinomadura sp. SCN-SB TaxID=3373092 RepID=UPI00375317DC